MQCGRHNDIFKLWLMWKSKVGRERRSLINNFLLFLFKEERSNSCQSAASWPPVETYFRWNPLWCRNCWSSSLFSNVFRVATLSIKISANSRARTDSVARSTSRSTSPHTWRSNCARRRDTSWSWIRWGILSLIFGLWSLLSEPRCGRVAGSGA